MIEARDYVPHAERAHAHAERKVDDWGSRAADLFVACAKHMGCPILTEEAALFARVHGALPDPPDGRAWGAVVRKLKTAGRIRSVGYAPAHDASPKSLWVAA